MSGDAGGILAVLMLAPAIIGGVVLAGMIYGAIVLGGALVSGAADLTKKKVQENNLVVDSCSADLEKLYQNMEAMVVQQARSYEQLTLQTQRELEAAASQLQTQAAADSAASLAQLNKVAAQAHRQVSQTMENHARTVQKTILEPGRKQLLQCADALDAAAKAKSELAQWKKQDEISRSNQKAIAYESLRDAAASIRLMETLAKDANPGFRQEFQALKAAYEQAEKNFQQEMYEAAFSASRTVIREVAIQVARQQADQMEMDLAAVQLRARIQGLIEEMAHRRMIHIPDPEECGEEVVEDLDEFSQGQYSAMQQTLEERKKAVNDCATAYELQRIAEEFENELEPRAVHIMEVAQQVMQGYHEELKILAVVEEFMESQNYTMDWIAPVADDISQKLVAHFRNNASGSTISFTLENNATADDVMKMVMDMLCFYESGNVVTEQEKKALRDGLNAALKKAGIIGGVECQGRVNLPASDTRMNKEDEVLDAPPKQIL